MREECEYEILSSKSWEPKPSPKPSPIPGPLLIDKDDYGLQIECDFKDNSLKTKILNMYSINKTNQKYILNKQLEILKENNILSYSEYEVFYKKNNDVGLYTVDELKAEKKFYWKLVDIDNKYYSNQKQCEKEINKIKKQYKSKDININKLNTKVPPMPLKEYYGIYCRNMQECFLDKQRVRHVIKNINGKNHIWEGVYEKDKNIIVCNDIEYKSKSPLNLFAKNHIKNVKPNRTNVTVNAWEYCEYYCNKEEQWITTLYMNPI